MRDVEKLREKVELSLDDRQIAGLAFAALLLLGGVFALGLMVGRNLGARAPLASPAGDLAALDESQKAEAARPAPVKPAPKAEAVEEPQVADAAVVPAPAIKAEAHKPEAAPHDASAHKADTAAHDSDTEADVAPAAHKPLTVAAAKPAVVAPAKPVAVHSTQEIVLTAPPGDLGAFTIQIGASQDKADAQRLEGHARGAGLKPYVVEAQLGNKGTWYRVRVGSFKDKDAANRYRKDVERELRQSAVVMPTH